MKTCLSNLKRPALTGAALALPFLALELVFNASSFSLKTILDTVALFGLLWLLPAAFVLIGFPLARSARAGENVLANPAALMLKTILLALIAVVWASLLADQLPCFLGVPNCD
jgi:hypothetical protein